MAVETATIRNTLSGVSNSGDNVNHIKTIYVELAATADDGDTATVTLADWGIKTLWGISGWIHSTANSVIVLEAPTTSVTAGVLTITVGGAADDKLRSYRLYGV